MHKAINMVVINWISIYKIYVVGYKVKTTKIGIPESSYLKVSSSEDYIYYYYYYVQNLITPPNI